MTDPIDKRTSQQEGPTESELIELGRSAIQGFLHDRPEQAAAVKLDVDYDAMNDEQKLALHRRWGGMIHEIVRKQQSLGIGLLPPDA